MRYSKATPRLTVKFIDSDTDKILFEVKDRTWMTVSELLTDDAMGNAEALLKMKEMGLKIDTK